MGKLRIMLPNGEKLMEVNVPQMTDDLWNLWVKRLCEHAVVDLAALPPGHRAAISMHHVAALVYQEERGDPS